MFFVFKFGIKFVGISDNFIDVFEVEYDVVDGVFGWDVVFGDVVEYVVKSNKISEFVISRSEDGELIKIFVVYYFDGFGVWVVSKDWRDGFEVKGVDGGIVVGVVLVGGVGSGGSGIVVVDVGVVVGEKVVGCKLVIVGEFGEVGVDVVREDDNDNVIFFEVKVFDSFEYGCYGVVRVVID